MSETWRYDKTENIYWMEQSSMYGEMYYVVPERNGFAAYRRVKRRDLSVMYCQKCGDRVSTPHHHDKSLWALEDMPVLNVDTFLELVDAPGDALGYAKMMAEIDKSNRDDLAQSIHGLRS